MTARARCASTTRSYELRGAANRCLPHGFRARANVNYFSSFTSMQTLNTNVYDASRNNRTYGGQRRRRHRQRF